MDTVVEVLVSVVMLFVVAWLAIFGGLGALLSRARGGSVAAGFVWGAVLGPIGWIAIYWRTRVPRQATATGWTDQAKLDDEWGASLLSPPGGDA